MKTVKNEPLVSQDGEIMELPRWKTLFNIHMFPRDPGYKNTLPSETIPNMSMSISDLLRRFNSGLDIPRSDMEYLDNEIPLPLIKDLTDVQEVEQYISDLHQRIDVAKLEREAKIRERMEKEKHARQLEIEEIIKQREAK